MSQKSIHLIKSPLLLGVTGLSIALAQPAFAEENAEENAEEHSEDENVIVVTGSIRSAQEASIEAKRQAINLADIAAADAVGRFPDQNSAAAIARLPGVAVQRDQGQERYIQVRGAPNRWNSVSIDGIPMVGVDESGNDRAFRFDAVPAVMLSQITINKSLTAEMQADAIVATIDLQTYSPLDAKGFHVSGDIGYGFMGLGGGEQRQGSIRASWANDVVGFMVGGSHYRRKQLTDNREVGSYDALGPTEIDIRQYQIERWNNSVFGGIEIAPTDNLKLFVKGTFTEFNDDEQRNMYELRLDRAAGGTRGEFSGDLVGVPLRGSFNYAEYRNKNYIGTIGGDFNDDNGFKASLRLNYTRTENSAFFPFVQSSTSGTNSPSLNYDRTENNLFPIVTLYQTVSNGSGGVTRGPALTNFNQGILNAARTNYIDGLQRTRSDAYTAKLDLEKDFNNGLTVKGGLYYTDRSIDGSNTSFANVVPIGSAGASVGQPFDVNSFVTSTPWDTGFPLGFTLNYVDNVGMRAAIDKLLPALQAAGIYDPAKTVDPTNKYLQDESILAGYVSAQMEMGEGLLMTGGVRVERYKMKNSGTANIGGTLTSLTVSPSYTDIFPSLNLRYDTGSDLILRLSGQRGVARPAFGAVRVGAGIDDTASPGTISGGNPGLLPEYAWGLDASIEYYLPGNGAIALSAFYRWLDNPFYQQRQPVGSNVFDSNNVDRSAYLLTSTFNGENGKLYGAELNVQHQFDFLPSPLDGFGVQGNLTLIKSSFDIPAVGGNPAQKDVPFTGQSNTIANASLFYEKYGFSGRISYQWRSDWLDTLGGLGSGESRRAYSNLDVSLRYAINDNFTLYADLNNLTDEKYIAFTGAHTRPTEVEQIGSRYMFGVRFGF